MAKYSVVMNRTASTSLGPGSVRADATRPRRGKFYDMSFGSEATPGDFAFLWQLKRFSGTVPTGTGVTPEPLDPANSATEEDALENHTAEAGTPGNEVMAFPLNQRSTFR